MSQKYLAWTGVPAVVLVLLGATVVRLLTVTVFDVEPVVDFKAYMNVATSLLQTGTIDDGQGNVAFYSPGYPIFLTPFFAAFGASPNVAQLVNVFLGVVSVYLVFFCAMQVFANRNWAIASAVLWAVYPPSIFYAEYVAKENLTIVILLVMLALLLLHRQHKRVYLISSALGATFSFGLLVSPSLILTGALPILIFLGVKTKPIRISEGSVSKVLAFGVLFLFVLTPWFAYTDSKLGQPVFSTNGSFNLYLGNNPAASVGFVGIENTPIGAEWQTLRSELGEVDAFSMLRDLALEHIIANPGRTIWLGAKKLIYFWTPPWHRILDPSYGGVERFMRVAWLICYLLILALSLVPFAMMKKWPRELVYVYSFIGLYWLVHAAAYIIFRYRLPVMPLLCITAIFGARLIWTWLAERRQREIVSKA